MVSYTFSRENYKLYYERKTISSVKRAIELSIGRRFESDIVILLNLPKGPGKLGLFALGPQLSWSEHLAHNRTVLSSNLSGPTKQVQQLAFGYIGDRQRQSFTPFMPLSNAHYEWPTVASGFDVKSISLYAPVMESADIADLKSVGEIRAGSNPARSTKNQIPNCKSGLVYGRALSFHFLFVKN